MMTLQSGKLLEREHFWVKKDKKVKSADKFEKKQSLFVSGDQEW